MKKLLIILTILFSTLLFTDNVSAKTYHFGFENSLCDDTGTYCLTENGSISYTSDYYTDGHYALNISNTSTSKNGVIFENLEEIIGTSDFTYSFDYYQTNNGTYRWFGIVYFTNSQYYANYTDGRTGFGVRNNSGYGIVSNATSLNEWNKLNFKKQEQSITISNTGTTNSGTWGPYTNTSLTESVDYIVLGYNGSNNLNGYIDNFVINIPDNIPTIDITKENETTVTIDNETFISSVTLNTEFSIVDNEKYLYMYKYGIDSEWITISLTQTNSFSRTYNYNDTLYVQVLDIKTNEVVSSSTFTVDLINYNFEPYVDVVEKTPSSCFFYKNGLSYTICKELNLIAKNLNDGNYIASYSYNRSDWFDFVDLTISLNENTTIYFQIINYLTNEVSYRSTYTVGNIDTDISDLGIFNTYSSTYDKDTSFITAYINIYNLLEPVQDNYKIYYSTNSTSFTDITLLLNDMTNYYQYEINNINENKTIYFKITDLNNNILYTSTYSINYQVQATQNSNFFTDFRTNFHGLSDIISMPLYAIKKLNKGVCSPLVIPIPYTHKSISLPCMTTLYQNNIPEILNIWQIVTNGIISYYIILDLFRIVKSFKEPEEDKIEVVNL